LTNALTLSREAVEDQGCADEEGGEEGADTG